MGDPEVSEEHWHIALCVGDDDVFISPPFDADDFEDAHVQGRTLFAAYLAQAEQETSGKRLKQDVRCIGVWQCGYNLMDANTKSLHELL